MGYSLPETDFRDQTERCTLVEARPSFEERQKRHPWEIREEQVFPAREPRRAGAVQAPAIGNQSEPRRVAVSAVTKWRQRSVIYTPRGEGRGINEVCVKQLILPDVSHAQLVDIYTR